MPNLAKTRRDIAALREYAEGLVTVARGLPPRRLTHPTTAHFSFLVVCLSVKQTYHLMSVIALLDAGQERDAAVISRLMLEAMAIEQWVAQDPDPRAELWRLYALVMDYQLLQDHLAHGVAVPAGQAEAIRSRALKEAGAFLTAKSRRALTAGRPLPPNPFLGRWHVLNSTPLSTDELFRQVGANEQYRLYSQISDWVHSNPRAFGTLIERKGARYFFTLPSLPNAASALAAATQAMAFALDHVNLVFRLELKELETLREALHQELAKR